MMMTKPSNAECRYAPASILDQIRIDIDQCTFVCRGSDIPENNAYQPPPRNSENDHARGLFLPLAQEENEEERRREKAMPKMAEGPATSTIDWAHAIPVLLHGEPGVYEEDLCLNALGEARIDVRIGRALKDTIWNRWSSSPQFRAVSSWDIIMRTKCLPSHIPIHSRFVSFYGAEGCTPERGVCDVQLYVVGDGGASVSSW